MWPQTLCVDEGEQSATTSWSYMYSFFVLNYDLNKKEVASRMNEWSERVFVWCWSEESTDCYNIMEWLLGLCECLLKQCAIKRGEEGGWLWWVFGGGHWRYMWERMMNSLMSKIGVGVWWLIQLENWEKGKAPTCNTSAWPWDHETDATDFHPVLLFICIYTPTMHHCTISISPKLNPKVYLSFSITHFNYC